MTTGTPIGSLFIELLGDASGYRQEINEAVRMTRVSTSSLTSLFAGASAAIVGSLAAISTASVLTFATFDDAMTKSMAIMSDVSSHTRKEMESVARSVATHTATSATKAAEGYYFLASAGLDAQQMMKAMPIVEKFSAAGALNLAHATDLLTNSVSSLGLASHDSAEYLKNMTKVADILTAAGNLSNGSAEQFAISLRTKVASSLRNLNKDLEEGVAVLMVYADQGMKAEYAGEAFSQVLRDLQVAMQKNKQAWDDMNLKIYDTNGNMLPMVDIISQLETRFGALSDENKRGAFMMLGFQDRSVAATLSLMGTSEKIRQYEAQLRQAGGTTQKVATQQLASFTQQMLILKNRVAEVLIDIGDKLVPVLMLLNIAFNDSYTASGQFSSEIDQVGSVIRDVLVTAVGMAMDAFAGWRLIIYGLKSLLWERMRDFQMFLLGGQIAILTLSTVLEKAVRGWQGLFDLVWMGIRRGYGELAVFMNEVQLALYDAINSTAQALGKEESLIDTTATREEISKYQKYVKALPSLDEVLNRHDMKTANGSALEGAIADWKVLQSGTDEYSKNAKEAQEDLRKLVDAGLPSENMLKSMDAMSRKLFEEKLARDANIESINREKRAVAELEKFFGDMDKRRTGLGQASSPWLVQVAELKQAIAYPWEASIPLLEKYKAMLKDGAITQEQFNRAVEKLNFRADFTDPLEEGFRKVREWDELLKLKMISAEEYKAKVDELMGEASPFLGSQNKFVPTGDGTVDQIMQQQQEMMQMQQHYAAQKAAVERVYDQKELAAQNNADELIRIEEEKMRILEEMQANYAKRQEAAQTSQNQLALQSASSLFGSLADIGESYSGKQNKLYKTMFAVSKAFAIADAMVKIQQGVANAASLPWPANLAAMASTAAAAAGIVSNIVAIRMNSFEGGGLTGNGDRVGGLDGRGGRLAVLHPNEQVIDLARGQSAGGNGMPQVNIIVNNYSSEKVDVKPRQDGSWEVQVGRIEKALAANVSMGKGPLADSFERAYGAERGKV